jgi:hypothetical protein
MLEVFTGGAAKCDEGFCHLLIFSILYKCWKSSLEEWPEM